MLGPLILWGKEEKEKKALRIYAKNLGLAYQLADDLKDGDGFFKSEEEAFRELEKLRKKSLTALKLFGKRGRELESLSLFRLRSG